MPTDVIFLYNPSNHANNVAVDDLRKAWPGLYIVQTVVEGRTPVVGVSHQLWIPKGTWGNMDRFASHYREYVVKNRFLRSRKVGFYPVWSSIAEDAEVARTVQRMGLHWIGASPESMDLLGKVEYKKICTTKGLPTADFFTLETQEKDFDKACAKMVELFHQRIRNSALDGEPFFVKSEFGGGGRGSKRVDLKSDDLLTSIQKVAAETKRTDGIYVEKALDLHNASMYQLEMEVDAGSVVDGGRLVYFNKRNQKMVELGFSASEICRFIPKSVFDASLAATEKIATISNYDGRGTNEILLVKTAESEWKLFCSEFNKRVQVEHKALSYLKRVKTKQKFNTIGDQVMRSCGFRPPNYKKDLHSSGANACAHIRLLTPEITPDGEVNFTGGVDVDGVILPKNFSATIHTGKLYIDTDAQFGNAMIHAPSWEKLLVDLQRFSRDTVLVGRNVKRDYFRFLQKFFTDPRVADLSLPCNKTFDVLRNKTQFDSRTAQVIAYLNGSVSRVLVNGYRPDEGVKNRTYPTDDQLEQVVKLRDNLLMMGACHNTPFLAYLDHLDEDRYYDDLREVIGKQRGAMVSIFPRDVQQECGGSESHLISFNSRLLMERYGALCGYIGYEMGGAQYQTAEMNKLSSSKVQTDGILCNLATFSLTRSHWMNALEKLSNGEIELVLADLSERVRSRFHLKQGGLVPYFPFNFHAGNVPEQDEVSFMMLSAGLSPIPNFVWDPRFTMPHYEDWLARQFACWDRAGRTLHHIRIKNPGQQREFTSENILQYVAASRALYKRHYNDEEVEPIVHLHNHNFNGLASHVAYAALKSCQDIGYNLLVVDTAPPLMTHNSNLVAADALNLSQESRDALHVFNESAHSIWQLTERFRHFSQVRIDPWTVWAGGTGSSDLTAAEKIGIDRKDVESAKLLGAQVTGLGGIVTPYSQWCMVVGYTCYKSGMKTLEHVKAHIESGGTLNLPQSIIVGINDWKTLLPRPPLMDKLLSNFKEQGMQISSGSQKRVFDPKQVEEKIRQSVPQHPISTHTIARVVSYGDFALKTLKAECEGEDHSWMLRYPEIGYARPRGVKKGMTFSVKGNPVTFEGMEDVADSADVILTYKFEGQFIRVRTQDNQRAAKINQMVQSSVPTADPKNPNHVAAFMPGMIEEIHVKIGQKITEGETLYSVNSMKMVTAFKASKSHNGKIVERIYAYKGEELQFGSSGAPPLVMSLTDPQL